MDQTTARESLLALVRGERTVTLSSGEWQAIAQLAHQHGVEGILYRNLKKPGLGIDVPPDLLERLQSRYWQFACGNQWVYRALGPLVAELEQAGVPCILLKGAYLVDRIYQNPGARPMGDVDLLVKERDLERVDEITLRLGFVRSEHSVQIAKEAHHLEYAHVAQRLYVELHWTLVDAIRGLCLDMNGIWERSRPEVVAGLSVQEMAPEDQVLHLCVHASVHAFEHGLRAMCDLAETLRHYGESMDWECLHQRAQLWGAERCVYLNLRLAKQLLGAPVPDGYLATIESKDADEYYAVAEEHLFSSADGTARGLPHAPGVAEFWGSDSPAHNLLILRRRLFPSRQSLAMRYPVAASSPRVWLYYALLFKDTLARYGRVAWDLYRGENDIRSRAIRQNRVIALKGWLLQVHRNG